MRVGPTHIHGSINQIIAYLVEKGLADDQNFASIRLATGGVQRVSFDGAEAVSAALRSIDYAVVYDELVGARAFNVRMADGGLVQMMYEFEGEAVRKHRLAFFPAVGLDEFQRAPEIYMEDEPFGNIVARNTVPFPIRFDYDAAEARHRPIVHPKSHLTLGQYPECRIPVSAPVSPPCFMDFLLRNLYDTRENRYAEGLPGQNMSFEDCLDPSERTVMHVVVPG